MFAAAFCRKKICASCLNFEKIILLKYTNRNQTKICFAEKSFYFERECRHKKHSSVKRLTAGDMNTFKVKLPETILYVLKGLDMMPLKDSANTVQQQSKF